MLIINVKDGIIPSKYSSPKWQDVKNFNEENSIVNVGKKDECHLFAKKEQLFKGFHRAARVALGIFASVISVGFLLFCPAVQNLFKRKITVCFGTTINNNINNVVPFAAKNADSSSSRPTASSRIKIASEPTPAPTSTVPAPRPAPPLSPENVALLKQCAREVVNNPAHHGYPIAIVDLLAGYYLKQIEKPDIPKVDFFVEKTQTAVSGNQEIVLADHLSLTEKNENKAQELINLLTTIKIHQNPPPKKIFIPYQLSIPGKESHVVLLVIEPDRSNWNKAKITLINTWGSNRQYSSEDSFILAAAARAYPNSETTCCRNDRTAFSGPYCGIDCVENIRYLAKVDDIQKHIKDRKLKKRSSGDIRDRHQEHVAVLRMVA